MPAVHRCRHEVVTTASTAAWTTGSGEGPVRKINVVSVTAATYTVTDAPSAIRSTRSARATASTSGVGRSPVRSRTLNLGLRLRIL
jgi:hypothetical protein